MKTVWGQKLDAFSVPAAKPVLTITKKTAFPHLKQSLKRLSR